MAKCKALTGSAVKGVIKVIILMRMKDLRFFAILHTDDVGEDDNDTKP